MINTKLHHKGNGNKVTRQNKIEDIRNGEKEDKLYFKENRDKMEREDAI